MQDLHLRDAFNHVVNFTNLRSRSSVSTSETWIHLLESLDNTSSFTTLDLLRNDIDDNGVKSICDALLNNTTVETLNLEGNLINDKGAKYLADLLKVNNTLKNLILAKNQIGANGFNDICEALKNNSSLIQINIKKNLIGDQGLKSLYSAFQLNNTLSILHLGENKIGPSGIQVISESLKLNTSLIKLKLSNNILGNDGTQFLSETLKNNNSLLSLELGGNQIGDKGAQYLAELLKVNNTIETLKIGNNKISDIGAQSLGESLKENKKLKKLYLSKNQIGNDGIQSISEALKINTKLELLYFSENQIGFNGLQLFCEALKINTTLKILNLKYNNIGDKGAKLLSEVLTTNQTLKIIIIDKNQITDKGLKLLNDSLRSNTTLIKLDLEENKFGKNAIMYMELINSNLEKNQIISQIQLKSIEENIKLSNEIKALKKSYNSKIDTLRKENLKLLNDKDSQIDIFKDYLTSFLNDIVEICGSITNWSPELILDSKNIINLDKAKQTLEKINRATSTFISLKEIRSLLNLNIATLGDIDSINEFKNEIQNWISNREICMSIIDQLKNNQNEQSQIEDTLETKEIQLLLDRKRKIISNEDEEIALQLIEIERNKLMKVKIDCKQLIDKIYSLNNLDLLNSFNLKGRNELYNELENNSEKLQLISILNDTGKLSQLSLRDYSKTSQYLGDTYAKNLEGENVVLKKYEISTHYQIQRALHEISLLMKLQNRPYINPIKSAFLSENNGQSNLYIEIPDYGVGNLLHWIKGISPNQNAPYNGISLRTQKSNKDFKSIKRILLQIVEAICDLHSLGIEHKDLNPENIIIDSKGIVKLTKFSHQSTNDPNEGQTIMTLRYAPPERKTHKELTDSKFGSWDTYSLGIIFYECLCDLNDIKLIDMITTNPSILIKSGELLKYEDMYELILSMIHQNPSNRKSIYEIAKELKNSLQQSHDEIINRFQLQVSNIFNELKSSIQIQNDESKFVLIEKNNIVQSFTQLMNQFTDRSDISKTIKIKFTEMNLGFNGTVRDVIDIYLESLLLGNHDSKEGQKLFTFKDTYFTPSNKAEFKEEMEAFGRFIFHSIIHGFTLHMRLSPLIYFVFSNQIPYSNSGILKLFRRFDPQSVSFIEQSYTSSDFEDRELAKHKLFEKRLHFFGSEYRMKNIQHIHQGFTQFMSEHEKTLLKSCQWNDVELLCCGPENISSEIMLMCMNSSLSSEEWNKNFQTRQTRDWFISWIKTQNSDGLRKFIQFATGRTFIPAKMDSFVIKVNPSTNNSIRSLTFLHKVKIGTTYPTGEVFFNKMQTAIEDFSKFY